MKLVEMNWHPSNRQLRQFGIICLIALPVLGWLWGGDLKLVSVLLAAGLALAIGGLVVPKALTPVFVAFTILAVPIGVAVGELAMLLIYLGVFLPIGTAFRLLKRDALQLGKERAARSYWQPIEKPGDVSSYYRQS